MVAPISRASIIWGKCLGGAIVATLQSRVLLALLGTVGIGWHVPLGVQLHEVLAITLGLISLAAKVFKMTE